MEFNIVMSGQFRTLAMFFTKTVVIVFVTKTVGGGFVLPKLSVEISLGLVKALLSFHLPHCLFSPAK